MRGGATSAQIQSSSSPPPPLPPPPPPPPSHSRLTHRCLFTASASASAARLTTWGGLLSADMLSGRWWCAEGAVNLAVGAGSRQARKQRPPPPAVSWCTRPTAAPVPCRSVGVLTSSAGRKACAGRLQIGKQTKKTTKKKVFAPAGVHRFGHGQRFRASVRPVAGKSPLGAVWPVIWALLVVFHT